MKVALVHEWFNTWAGSEKVLEVILSLFPEADIFSLIEVLPDKDRTVITKGRVKTTFLQRIPYIRHIYRDMLPLMPIAIEQLDMSGYDLIISNSHAVAKGVITGPDQLHICYCYSPMRYAWDLQAQYLRESRLERGIRSALARYFLHKIRVWDQQSAQHVDHFISCSHYIARRVWKAYRRESEVVYPNVETDIFTIGDEAREDFYFASSRMVPYKKMHLIVQAFAKMPHRRLVMIGTGPQFNRIRKLATPNVTLLGYQEFPVLLSHLRRARAFIFAAEEDFGIAPIEAQACGTPVLAFGRGGATETIIDGETGMYFYEQTPEAIMAAVDAFEARETPFDPDVVRRNALRFSTQNFKADFARLIWSHWDAHVARLGKGRPRPLVVSEEAA
ncbi:glycosyltransferase family 4 protein [Acidisoma silvae]|uniref:Glycosyltransferase family 4 protein n=1 Tax=Acidisoma silvae TaxID=2802396 RepID=A0A963YV20_9PROT|nr:glycosyltransferase family 4 protein [Acidisoma silvae]MCB8877642.1 glycosyltransferase family 4 protein [Acidisoma silvae]